MFSIKSNLVRATTIGAAGVAAMAAFMAPASAGTAAAHLSAGPAVAAAKPNSNIVGSGKKVKYSPTSLNVKWSGPTEKTCTAKKESLTITNTTKASEQVTYQGKAFGSPIPAGGVLGVCAWGTGTASATFGLKANKKAKLTVNVS